MKERKLELGIDCDLVLTEWEALPTEVELVYTEHSTDPWYSDSETCVTIDREKAVEIIKFLREAYGIEG